MVSLIPGLQYDHRFKNDENQKGSVKDFDLIYSKINTLDDLLGLHDYVTDLIIKSKDSEVENIFKVLDKKSIRSYNSYIDTSQRRLEYFGFSF